MRLDLIGSGLCTNIGLGLCAGQGAAHGITIVFTDKKHRQTPEGGKVHRLMELTLGHSTFAKKAGCHRVLTAHPVCKRKPAGKRQATADNRVSTIEVGARIKQMHRAATPARASLSLAIHLGKNRGHRDAPHQRVTVFAVGGDQAIPLLQNGDHTGGDRLLPVIEMQKPADLLLGVEFGAFVLELADPDHIAQQ